MAKWIKTLATKLDDLSLIPEIHGVERTNSRKLSSDLHMCCGMCMLVYSCNPNTWETGRSGVQGHFRLYSRFKASLGYKIVLKIQINKKIQSNILTQYKDIPIWGIVVEKHFIFHKQSLCFYHNRNFVCKVKHCDWKQTISLNLSWGVSGSRSWHTQCRVSVVCVQNQGCGKITQVSTARNSLNSSRFIFYWFFSSQWAQKPFLCVVKFFPIP